MQRILNLVEEQLICIFKLSYLLEYSYSTVMADSLWNRKTCESRNW